MSLTIDQIIWDMGSHWVRKDPNKLGMFEVYHSELTHSVRVATFHFSKRADYGRDRAIDKCCQLAGCLGPSLP